MIGEGVAIMAIYAQIYANSCNSSYIDLASDAEGVLAWEKRIPEDESETTETRLLLSADNAILVIDDENITQRTAAERHCGGERNG